MAYNYQMSLSLSIQNSYLKTFAGKLNFLLTISKKYDIVSVGKTKHKFQKIRRLISPAANILALRVCEAQISKNTQAYRSGHNEAVLKTVCCKARGFESLSLRHKNKCHPLWVALVFIVSVMG